MSTHVADRIMAALETQLATVTGIGSAHVFMQPLVTLTEADLPALIVEDFEDAVVSEVGFFPVEERHELSFTVFVCQMVGSTGFRTALGTLHHDTEMALVGSLAARTLDGLLTRGLIRGNARYDVDADTLQKPVGGWRIPFRCTYFLRSDEPGKVEKE